MKASMLVLLFSTFLFAQKPEAIAPYNDGVNLYNGAKYAEAVKKFDAAIGADAKFAKAFYMKGISLKALKNGKQAIETLKKCVEIDSAYAKAWEILGVLYVQSNQSTEAQKAYQKAVRLDPRAGDAHFGLGTIYMDYGNFVKAAEAFQHSAQIGGKRQGDAYLYWGVCANQFGDHESAVTALEKAVGMVKTDFAYYQLGHAYVHTKKYDQAITAGEKSLKLGKKYAGAVYVEVIGEAYEEKGEKEKAKDTYSKALAIKEWKDQAKQKIDKVK